MRITLTNCQQIILDEVANPEMRQEDVALTYAMTMDSGEGVDWPTINTAIMKRWGKNGLIKVKTTAAKLLEEKRQAN